MNLFRSEEHARRWSEFNPEVPDGLRPLSDWLERFSGAMFRERGRSDYITWWTAWRAAQLR
jgi:hypothetical protein